MNNDKTENAPAAAQIEEKYDFTGLLLDYLGNWKWFVLSVIVCLVAAYYWVSTIIPTYQVDASIYLRDESTTNSSAMLDMADPMGQFSPYIDETEIEIMRSQNNLINIVDSLQLMYRYYNVGRLRDVPVYQSSPVLVRMDSKSLANLKEPIVITIDKDDDGYDVTAETSYDNGPKEKQSLTITKLPAQIKTAQGVVTLYQSPYTAKFARTEKVVIVNPRQRAAAMSGALKVEFAKNSQSILRLTLQTPVIEEGQDVMRVLIDFYNKRIMEDKNRSAIQTEAFILDRLGMISNELRDVENRLRDYRQANNIADLAAQTGMNINTVSESESQLASIDAEREILSELERMITKQDAYAMVPTVSQNAALTQSLEAYNQEVANYDRARQTMGADHPMIETMQSNLNRRKSEIQSNIRAARQDIAARRRSVAAVDARSTGRLAAQPTIDKGLNEIFREQQVKVNIYTFLLQKREEIALQKTLATPTAQFIDNPSGSGPVAPRRVVYLGVAFLLGLLIPAAVVAAKRQMFPKFSDKDELERITKVPILSEICLNDDPNKEIVVAENEATPIAELFRLLRNNLNFVRTNGEKKVILVTSSVSGEGKTFIAINLAMTYALTGKRVIVLGMDIRRPVLARVCGLSNTEGATNYLSGQTHDLSSLIKRSSLSPNLDVLPAGPVPPNPNELLMSENCQHMFQLLRDEYDYVIIDSAPIGMVSDTFLITPYSDVQIYITRANFSTRRSLKVLHDAINQGFFTKPYIVINGVNVRGAAYIYRRFGHYGYYGKNTYGYAKGYGQDGTTHRRHSHRPWYKKLLDKLPIK